MIRAQRAAHRVAWVAIALVATPLLALALSDRPRRPTRDDSTLPASSLGSASPSQSTSIGSSDSALGRLGVVASRDAESGANGLRISVATDFALPETLVYASRREAIEDALPDDARLLGVAVAGRSFVATLEPEEDRLILFCLPRQEIVVQAPIDEVGAAR